MAPRVPEPESLAIAAKLLRTEFAHERARGAREKVVDAVFNFSGSAGLDVEVVDFTLGHLELVSPEVLALRGEQFGLRLWWDEPQRFAQLLDADTTTGREIARRALLALPDAELVSRLAEDSSLLAHVLRLRPQIMADQAFWQHSALAEMAVGELTQQESVRVPALSAMLRAGAQRPLRKAVELLGADPLLAAAAKLGSEERVSWRDLADGLRPAVAEAAVVAEFLLTSPACPRVLLMSIARLVPPMRVPFQKSGDPWVQAVVKATGDLGESDDLYLSGYLLARALSARSPQTGDLLRLSFEQVYTAAAVNRLPGEVWELLDGSLPWVLGWEPWDKCHRLRQGVADTLARSGTPDDLVAVARDDRVFAEVVEALSGSYRGRKLLRKARRKLQEDIDPANRRRVGIVNAALS